MLNLSDPSYRMQFCYSAEKQTIFFIQGDRFWRITTTPAIVFQYDGTYQSDVPTAWEPV